MNWPAVISDGAWILGLALITSGSYQAWKRIDAGVRVPMQFRQGQAAGWRAPKAIALLFMPFLAGFLAMVFYVSVRIAQGRPESLLWAALSIGLPPLLAMAHFQHLDRAMKVLSQEGGLRR